MLDSGFLTFKIERDIKHIKNGTEDIHIIRIKK